MEINYPVFIQSERLRKLYTYVKSNYTSPCEAHGFDHILRVLKNISLIVENIDINKDIIYAAGLMHDYTRDPDRISKKHAEINAELSKKILPKFEYSKYEIAIIEKAIREHDNKKEVNRSIYSTILFEADKLDTFGEEGFNRWIILGTGDGLSRIDTIKGVLKIQFRFFNNYKYKLNVSKKLLKEKARILFDLILDEIGKEEFDSLINEHNGGEFIELLNEND